MNDSAHFLDYLRVHLLKCYNGDERDRIRTLSLFSDTKLYASCSRQPV
uniref:Uncharacterized protein n=1 Tax=Rhizophora mucronata TaxID=61149 RepID=A0A2P2PPR4_RHIMU